MSKAKEMLQLILNKGQYNQKELAKELGVDPAQVTRWLTNSTPNLQNFLKIQEIYSKLVA